MAMSELAHLVGEDAEHLWEACDSYKLYYKDNFVYGVIGVRVEDNILGIFSRANGDFTVGMLRDIIKFYHTTSVLLILDTYSVNTEKLLKVYGFTLSYNNNILFAIHTKEIQNDRN